MLLAGKPSIERLTNPVYDAYFSAMRTPEHVEENVQNLMIGIDSRKRLNFDDLGSKMIANIPIDAIEK